LICRCEEVSLGEIRQAWDQGARTLREIKGLTRLGMGNCQGRICGDLAVHLLVDSEAPPLVYEEKLASLGDLHVRPPIHPLKLSDLAAANRKEN
ncbi:MAG: FAD/NAD(P)-binding oxidoreductase, partial [Chloroflexi bacterium]|nr:FAD/NAD(P)-binding oxidoreductase [Chloroflexota bacterium]